MGWGSLSGRASVNPRSPEAFGICDRCNFTYNLKDLLWQHAWRGNDLVNIHLRVCKTCLDTPFENNRPLYMPPDPPPVDQPRVMNFALAEAGPQAWDNSNEYWDSGLDWDETGAPANTDVDYTP